MKSFFFLLLAVLFNLTDSVAQNAIPPLFPVTITHDFSNPDKTFNDVRELILNNYYSADITEQALYWAAIEGMLRHISPPENPGLAKIWTPEEYENILNSLKGVKVSLGFNSTFNTNDGSLTVTEVLEDSPAVGKLQVYDRIVRINGEVLKGKTLAFVNDLLDGPANSEANLKVIRDVSVMDVKLKRAAFPSNDLKVTVLPGRPAALVEIKNVSQGLTQQLAADLQKLKEQGVKKILLDLRNNPGGVLNEGVNIANLFLSKNNIIVRTVARSDKATPIVADREAPFDFEMVVLVNKSTASAAEIVASALQDHKRATIIGTKTFGKGVIETTYTLENQYRVKFISSAMYSPAGRSWQANGVLPDFLVQQEPSVSESMAKLPIDQRVNNDIYLITAIKLLQ
jgi:carboxyl-terminal processing protease